MRRTHPKSVGEVISEALSGTDARRRLAEVHAAECWPLVVGENIARQTGKPFVRNGVMTVRIPSAPLRSELDMSSLSLRNAINRIASPDGEEIVKSIRFIY